MALFGKKKNTTSVLIEQAIDDTLNLEIFDYGTSLDLLVDFFKIIRPASSSDFKMAEASLYGQLLCSIVIRHSQKIFIQLLLPS